MKTGIVTKNRNEGNFIKRMQPETRDTYIKEWIAACNKNELIPHIRITKTGRYYREICYEIHTTDTIEKGVMYHSRRESDAILRLPTEKRIESIKSFIAATQNRLLIPFIDITDHDADYRRIHYQIRTDIRVWERS